MLMFTLVLAAFGVAVAWLCLRWISVRNFWAKRGVPHTPPNPFLGSLGFLLRCNPAVWMREQYKLHSPAPYFGMWLFWKPAVVVQCPDLARRVLVKDSDVFRDRFLNSGTSDPIGSLNIFTVNDPTWSAVRRRLTPVFTAAKLRALYPLVAAKTKELLERIKRDHIEDNKTQDLRDLFANYTTDIISAAAFGLAGDATLTGNSPMRAITRDFTLFPLSRSIAFTGIFFAPYVVNFFRFTFFPKPTTTFFREVFSRIVAQRGGWQHAGVGHKRDLLDALLHMRQEALADGEEISEDIVLAQAAVFLQAGFDTSAVALTFTLYELAHNPSVQEKLYAELAEAESATEGELCSTRLAELPYLSSVIKESLRKYPTMGWLDRVAGRDYRLDDKVTVPKGTPLYVNAVGMHYAPEYFPEPDKYDPDRFLPENESNIKPYTYLPFGDGPRNCIGMRFAQQTMRCALSSLVLAFKFQPLEGIALPHEVGIDKKGLFLTPDCRLAVRFVTRV